MRGLRWMSVVVAVVVAVVPGVSSAAAVSGAAVSGAGAASELGVSAGGAAVAGAPGVARERSAAGDLVAGDPVSAVMSARLFGERVEVVGARSASSSVFALPDGSFASVQAAGPIWVRRGGDGTRDADWVSVDTDLVVDADGLVRAKAHPGDLVLAGAGAPKDGRLVSVRGRDAGDLVWLGWSGVLPAPRLEGPRAVYAGARPGVDLVVEATRTGFEQYFVVRERPGRGAAPELRVSVGGAGRVVVRDDGHGGLTASDGSGVLASFAVPQAWDARVDGERLHPVTSAWVWESSKSGLARHLPGQPAWTKPVLSSEPGVADRSARPGSKPSTVVTSGAASAGTGSGGSVKPKPGLAGDAAAQAAKASPTLPVSGKVSPAGAAGASAVDWVLSVPEEFWQDPATVFPVVVDPLASFGWGLDTWVQSGVTGDQSGSTELRLGTYDGGAHVARSFINFNFGDLVGKEIVGAELDLFEWHSWSCSTRNWQLWNTEQANTGHRWTAQPAWYDAQSTSSSTTGYSSSACVDGWVAINTQGIMQAWANGGFTAVGVGLKAENESDTYGWKKFNAADSGANVPAMWVNYNSYPGPATNLTVTPSGAADGIVYTRSRQPFLGAVAHDADGGNVNVIFRIHPSGNGFTYWDVVANSVPAETALSVQAPANVLQEGARYSYIVHVNDGRVWNTANSGFYDFIVDTIAPPAPASVSSSTYPNDGAWHGAAGTPGTFTFTPTAGEVNPAGFMWGLDAEPTTTVTAAGAASVTVTPVTNGLHVLQVRSIDKAGNVSPVIRYAFNVGRGGLTSPSEGEHIVRRTQLVVTAEPVFTHAQFQWQRPGATTPNAIPLSALAKGDGSPVTQTWLSLADIASSYASLDAAAVLGHLPGPIQVSVVLATDASGANPYTSPWVTITVDPNADGAASTQIGPGLVNLLTGDYSLSATDADELGLIVGRSASSRDPRAGMQEQVQLLTPAQVTVADLNGIQPVGVSATRASTGHAGGDSLRLVASGAGSDNYAALGGDAGGMRLGMRAGHSYRVSGWIFVPSATGLAPPSSRGLRINVFVNTPIGGYNEPATDGRSTQRPAVTDAWQFVSVDVPIPRDATEAFIRLYNGFDQASKDVFYDDLSVREIWAPLGPQWRLGIADSAADTGYTHLDQPTEDTVRLHLSGGGEVWFTGSGDGRWFPELGAEQFKLTGSTTNGWTLLETDGTVSTFASLQGSADARLTTTRPPAAAGATRLVYAPVDQTLRLIRIIGPTEPGVDSTPGPEGICGSATPARGCEVTELVYASATTAGAGTFGDYAGQVSAIQVWATDPATGSVTATVVHRYAYDTAGMLRQVWDPRVSPALMTSYGYDAAGRVTTLTPAGEKDWSFGYAPGGARAVGNGDLLDANTGRLSTVSRLSLVPGTVDTAGPTNVTTVLYAVPLTRSVGGPYDLDPAALASWGQKGAPTDATAVFGPADVPASTTVTATSPGPDGYKPASVYYLDSSGRQVNMASPAGPAAPTAGYIDTSEYDKYGNTTRILEASNRLLALGLGSSAATDLATLNLTGQSTAARAAALSSQSSYASNGIDLLSTTGPVRPMWSAGVRVLARLTTTNTYDQDKPDGQDYHLVTSSVSAAITTATPPATLDPVTTITSYAPQISGDASGWVIRKPTKVTVSANGTSQVSSIVRYDTAGRVVEARKPGATGSDALTSQALYYTAGTHPTDSACGQRPEWAGQACVGKTAAPITGTDPTRMGTSLPTRRITSYSRFAAVTGITETATGPVNGTSITQTRTTTTTLDAAERVTDVAVTGTNLGSTPLGTVRTTYSTTTGQALSTGVVNGASVTRQVDALGRTIKYTDASGAYATTSYDRWGQPQQYTEYTAAGVNIGSRTFTYDRAAEPRGLLTAVTDSVAGQLTASYGPDGQLLTQGLPGGVTLTIGYDPSASPLSRTYSKAGQTLGSSTITENTKGKWASHATTATTSTYTYDPFGRLTDVQQQFTAIGSCTWRKYGFNDRALRLTKQAKTYTSACPQVSATISSPDAALTYGYDSADRIVTDDSTATSPWTYDPLGRMTKIRSSLNPADTITVGYHDNDRLRSQTLGATTRSWTLDPLGRYHSYSEGPTNGPVNWAKTNHYTSDSDNPSWIAESATDATQLTRYVTGIDGRLALSTSKTGDRVLQLVDLHGDIMGTATLDNAGAVTTLTYTASDEYGTPLNLTTGGVSANAPPRYGWLGGAQRSGDTFGATILMGSRLYTPGIGRFTSIDPTPGGNANIYDYCTADPINCTDLTGNWPDWGAVLQVVAVVAEVVATVVPGPIGAAAGYISAGAYYATGNTEKAIEMGIVATAQLVGAGLAAKAAIKAVQVATKIGRAGTGAAREFRGALSAAKSTAHKSWRSLESQFSKYGPTDRGSLRLPNAKSKANSGNRNGLPYASRAAAEAAARADARLGGELGSATYALLGIISTWTTSTATGK